MNFFHPVSTFQGFPPTIRPLNILTCGQSLGGFSLAWYKASLKSRRMAAGRVCRSFLSKPGGMIFITLIAKQQQLPQRDT